MLTPARYRELEDRQGQPRWGADYVPAIMATRGEAPSVSNASILFPRKLGRRGFHVLSRPEKHVALLILMNPAVWDVHEQRVLNPEPIRHMLTGHPRAVGKHWPPFQGTLAVAERLDAFHLHPKVMMATDDDSTREWRAFPYIGDFLVFLADDDGAYAVNITVKNSIKDFRRGGPQSRRRRDSPKEIEKAILRHKIEEHYYADAGIRTQQVALEEIDLHLRWNLDFLQMEDTKIVDVEDSIRIAIIDDFAKAVGTPEPASRLARAASKRYSVEATTIARLVHQAIWRREIRVDLFRPFRMDAPLWPEVTDPFKKYQDWFKR